MKRGHDNDDDDGDFMIIKATTILNKNNLKNNKNVHQIRYT